ncbi:hypothetical protein LTR37_007489 [Vermiconidia calcicola]|uniref:Uncharacterized protein n=1 Tax=Vermiconidia calcicola TaxID=1690605 RepID=A0ACC3NDH0_9PEZI|nr:hypothetical protein LTR37_007489 [Vermiconidia calcicola]
MVTTRTKTDSLPEKKESFADTQARAEEVRLGSKRKRAKVEPEAKQSGTKKQKQPAEPTNDNIQNVAKASESKSTTASTQGEQLVERALRLKEGKQAANAPSTSPTASSPPDKQPVAPATNVKRPEKAAKPKAAAPRTTAKYAIVERLGERHPAATPPEREGATAFLDLPAELRNEIYALVVVQDDQIELPLLPPYVRQPKLLGVNRQIRAEALSIYYGENVFQIQGSTSAAQFMRSVSEEGLRALRSLQIYCPVVLTVKDAMARSQQLFGRYKERGLRRQTLKLQVNTGDELGWADLRQLKRLQAKKAARD